MNQSEQDLRISRLAAFKDVFDRDGFVFGMWSEPMRTDNGSVVMPYYELSAEAVALVDLCYKDGWVKPGFNWVTWCETTEAIGLRDAATLDGATVEQVEKLITVLVRQERFVDGSLASTYSSGLIGRILGWAERTGKPQA